MKRIVIDARVLGGSTGVYAENLLNKLQQIDSSNQYIVLLNGRGYKQWRPTAANFRALRADYKDYSLAEQLGLARLLYSLRPDLVHFCMPQQPLLYFGKRVTTVHDLTLVRFDNIDMNPLVYRLRKMIFVALLRNVVARSQNVLVPTNFMKADLVDFSGAKHAEKIVVTPEAGEPLADSPVEVAELKNKRFLFFVGNAFPYKNISRTVQAFYELKKTYPDFHLALAGKKDFFYEKIEQEIAALGVSDTHLLGYISEGQKRWLFQHAQAFVTASLSEGFHIPLLEAMYEQCPVISSNASCLPEVAGGAAIYFDPHSTQELVDAITSIIENQELRQRQIAKGNERVGQFSWQRMAQQTLDVYRSIVG